MLEIGIAISAASHAVASIKKGLSLHKDISDLTNEFSAFWDARDDIAEAKTRSENATLGGKVFAKQSVESFALEVALAEHKTKQLEKQLRELFIYSGQAEVYSTMMRVRREERKRRLLEARRNAEQRKFIADSALLITVLMFSIGSFSFILSRLLINN
tara:strand:- start:1531 stop:2004 length:474 start_codon:yes stop_codon:yes gene_type:complete